MKIMSKDKNENLINSAVSMGKELKEFLSNLIDVYENENVMELVDGVNGSSIQIRINKVLLDDILEGRNYKFTLFVHDDSGLDNSGEMLRASIIQKWFDRAEDYYYEDRMKREEEMENKKNKNKSKEVGVETNTEKETEKDLEKDFEDFEDFDDDFYLSEEDERLLEEHKKYCRDADDLYYDDYFGG